MAEEGGEIGLLSRLRRAPKEKKKGSERLDLSGIGKHLQDLVSSEEWTKHERKHPYDDNRFVTSYTDELGRPITIDITRDKDKHATRVAVRRKEGGEPPQWVVNFDGSRVDVEYSDKFFLDDLNKIIDPKENTKVEKVNLHHGFDGKVKFRVTGSKPSGFGFANLVHDMVVPGFTINDSLSHFSSFVRRLENDLENRSSA